MKTRATRLAALALLALLALSAGAPADDATNLKPFPAPKAGMARFVITLPHKERGEEDAFQVELIVGKEMLTDGVNIVRLSKSIGTRTLEGWGYNYYEVTGPDEAASTLMAPPEGAPQVMKFVTGQSLHIPYNSRLPIVIYAPKGCEVHYRIWKASDTTEKAVEK